MFQGHRKPQTLTTLNQMVPLVKNFCRIRPEIPDGHDQTIPEVLDHFRPMPIAEIRSLEDFSSQN